MVPGARFRQVSVAVAAGFVAEFGSAAVFRRRKVPGLVDAVDRSRRVQRLIGPVFALFPTPNTDLRVRCLWAKRRSATLCTGSY